MLPRHFVFLGELASHPSEFRTPNYLRAREIKPAEICDTKCFRCSQKFPGFLLQKEIKYLGGVVDSPSRPFSAIVGGSKVIARIHNSRVCTHAYTRIHNSHVCAHAHTHAYT